jgi:hypothetical protein
MLILYLLIIYSTWRQTKRIHKDERLKGKLIMWNKSIQKINK